MAKALASGKELAKELPPLYYLHNFDALLSSVCELYGDLFSEDELAYVTSLQQLSEAARGLYVRLMSRVGPVFRSEKIDYPELGPLPPLAQELNDAELLHKVVAPELEQILELCRKDELLELFGGNLDGAGRLKRDQLQHRIREAYTDAEEWVALWAAWYAGQLWEPRHRERIELLQLLFFGNRRQSLTDFVLSDLGVARYVDYPLDPAFRLFENREQLDEYLAITRLREIYYEAEEAGDIEALLLLVNPLCSATDSPALSARWNQLRNRVARQLEREKYLEEAQQVYRCSSDHPARERRVRILRSEGELESALQLCQLISAQPWCEAELDFALAQIPGLQKKLGQPTNPVVGISYSEQRLCLENSGVRVEEAVAQHYAQQWSRVYFAEIFCSMHCSDFVSGRKSSSRSGVPL